jgi:ADP-ribose pyrophosphatase YjhB (NUDIX family)
MTLSPFLRKLLWPVLQSWFRWRRRMTIGVRALVIDSGGRLLLVQPRFAEGWTLPGGGLERGETAVEGLARELKEESAVIVRTVPKLIGVYSHEREFRGDHVLLYLVIDFEPGKFVSSLEIVDARFFDLDKLPPSVTAGTARRIDEFVNKRSPAAHW